MKVVDVVYKKLDCPWCGNGIVIQGNLDGTPREQKCKWCRRLLVASVKFKGNKLLFDVNAKNFPEPVLEPSYKYGDRYSMSLEGME